MYLIKRSKIIYKTKLIVIEKYLYFEKKRIKEKRESTQLMSITMLEYSVVRFEIKNGQHTQIWMFFTQRNYTYFV